MSLSAGFPQDFSRSPSSRLDGRKTCGFFVSTILASLLLLLSLAVAGCGSGGYFGAAITSLSASAITIDAGQTFSIAAQESGPAPIGWSLSGANCSAATCGTLSNGTGPTTIYTAPAGLASQLQVTLTASVAGTQNKKTVSITVNPDPLISGTPPSGVVGVAYSTTLTASGGTGTLKLSSASGTLPPGLTFNPTTGIISGTPTAVGTYTFTAQVVDTSDVPFTAQARESITITTANVGGTLTLMAAMLPNGTVGTPYSATIGVAGGTAPYTCAFTAGTLPAGLSLSGCVVSGTPTATGTANLTVKATDSANPAATGTGPESITIGAAPSLVLASPPGGMVGAPYSAIIPVSGGTSPYTCVVTAGSLPAGLTLGPNCLVSGTPTTAGTANLTVKATDSSNPTLTTSGPVSLTIQPAAVTLTPGNPPSAVIGQPYMGIIPITGGMSPYVCTVKSGTLPAGLTLSGCTLTGTPTAPGTNPVVIGVTDSGTPPATGSGPVTITVNPAPLTLTNGTLPNGSVGVAYSSTIGVGGGSAPYTCTITAGTLPAGLTLGANCLVSGTPTVAATVNLTVKATDSSNPTLTTSGPVSLTITAAPVSVTPGNPPAGTVGAPYNGAIPTSGGTAPYTCTLTSGTLPAGLTLNNCNLTGTPTTPGTSPVTIGIVDSSKPPVSGSGSVTITINPATPVLTLGNPPAATVGTPYTGIVPVTGGTGPYTCTLNSGVVPAGLTFNNCVLSGTPTTPGSPILNVTATDSSNPKGTTTGNVTVTVNPVPPLTLAGSLPNATLNAPYTQTLHAAGGIAPYTYAVSSGTLPAGLTLSATGVLSGTPTAVGASSFTVTATDTETTPQTASLPLVLLVTYPVTASDSELKGPYAFLFQGYDDALAGVLAYQTATVGSFTADGLGGIANGELDSNHQSSNPAGATIASTPFLGTYTLGADNRGSLTLTTLNPNGTTAQTTTYALSVKAPVTPSTTTAQGSLIEFDGNQLRGTKGSGSLLQQTATSFTAGLTGSYAFGLSGDTPCLPSCTTGIVAGPVASVGQFAVSGSGSITTGTGDANIANVKYSSEALTGSYGVADGNGRIQLSLTTGGTPAGIFPTDYAVYLVNANQAFILSTDKHSSAILLAGSAQSQTLTPFANTSLSGPFVGYENAATNPGLVGATLTNVANLSTATIFRATADAAGTCNVTNVDVGGATQLVNGLTGLGSGAPILNALLGTYQSTGTAACTITGNGRGTLNYPVPNTVLSSTLTLLGLPATPPPARVVYLTAADRGYFLETGYAGLGQIEPQTGAPFNLVNFNGTYVYGEAPASSAVTLNASGSITANGAGAATSTEDLNLGVGTINVLQLGVTHNETYTAPDATSGRFLFNDQTVVDTSVVYVISPGRFVFLDTNPLTTSPSVNILY